MPPGKLLLTGLLLAVCGCTSSGGSATSTAATTAAPTPAAASPTTPASMSPEVIAACGHVRTAFEAQAVRDWDKVVAQLTAAWRVGHGAADRQLAAFLPAPGTVGVDDTQTLGEVTDSLTFACGLSTRPVPGTSIAPAYRRQVTLSEQAVDGVRIGTPADEAERLLRASLGDADEGVATCGGESYRRLQWGSFSVLFGKDGTGSVLHGWNLRAGISRVFYRLPFDVQPRDAVSGVVKRVPGAVGEGPPDLYVVQTDRSPDLRWVSHDKGAGGEVDEIAFRSLGCD
jgi:hypothetical protein